MPSSVVDDLIQTAEIETAFCGLNGVPARVGEDGVDILLFQLRPDVTHEIWTAE